MAKKSRNTKQKELILDEVIDIGTFFTAEDLFERVQKRDHTIGIATIYRFLKESKEQEKIHYYLCDRKTLYSLEGKSHCHFICERCGKTEHLDLKNIDSFKKEIKGSICHFQLDVFGTCRGCISKQSSLDVPNWL